MEKRYTCPYCGETYATDEELRPHVVKEHRGERLPVHEGRIVLYVNKERYSMTVEPQWTLYHVLHDRLGLTGSKQFCDRGACSSCTVICDGRPVLSCMMLAVECDGMDIQTVEGVAREKHPLVESYAEHHAMQCGYCTPGFVVTAKALLDRTPDPEADDIRTALAGNLCRCGTYPQHVLAIRDAAKKIRETPGGGEGER
jgi:aerobic-type carbon monoxide dehydrogenase small subunit (CoxS/CutS family)